MNLKGRNRIKPEFSLASMTDIVFLLLIFFMLASTLVTTNAIDILLPKASGKTENNTSVAVTIKENLTYYVDRKKVDGQALEGTLLSVLASKQNPVIILRAEKSVPIQSVVNVMDIANRHAFKVILAVSPY